MASMMMMMHCIPDNRCMKTLHMAGDPQYLLREKISKNKYS